jgi:hypothetical protein
MANVRAAGRWAACIAFIAWSVSGCGEWPRHAHLPATGPLLEPGVSLRGAVQVVWSISDAEGLDQPPGAPLGAIAPGEGVVVSGELVGSGWDGTATPLPLVGVACGSTGSRAPYAGDYRGEVEAFTFSVDAPTRMCVRGFAGDDTTSFDAVIHRLDDCDVPGVAVPERGAGDGEIPSAAGFAVLGPLLDHAVSLDSGRYTLVFSAYLPDDTLARPFEIGLSAFPDEDGLCPLLPSEREEVGSEDDVAPTRADGGAP